MEEQSVEEFWASLLEKDKREYHRRKARNAEATNQQEEATKHYRKFMAYSFSKGLKETDLSSIEEAVECTKEKLSDHILAQKGYEVAYQFFIKKAIKNEDYSYSIVAELIAERYFVGPEKKDLHIRALELTIDLATKAGQKGNAEAARKRKEFLYGRS